MSFKLDQSAGYANGTKNNARLLTYTVLSATWHAQHYNAAKPIKPASSLSAIALYVLQQDASQLLEHVRTTLFLAA
jgi:hypothetical protein